MSRAAKAPTRKAPKPAPAAKQAEPEEATSPLLTALDHLGAEIKALPEGPHRTALDIIVTMGLDLAFRCDDTEDAACLRRIGEAVAAVRELAAPDMSFASDLLDAAVDDLLVVFDDADVAGGPPGNAATAINAICNVNCARRELAKFAKHKVVST